MVNVFKPFRSILAIPGNAAHKPYAFPPPLGGKTDRLGKGKNQIAPLLGKA